MHNLAIAISQKENYRVTGSDDEIFEPSYSRLKAHGLLPEKTGWFPEKIHPGLEAVILGMHAKADNPELLRAKTLNLKIYSFPEYLYEQTKDKTRIVIGGSHGKTTTTAMILYVLNKLNIEVDYMVGAQIEGFDNMVKLSANTKIAVFEGDEYLTSPIDLRPKFHLYKPHIAILTGIAWDHINVFPTFENYVEQFSKFVEIIEPNGCLIYFSGDEELKKITSTLRSDLVPLPYSTPEYEIINGTTYIKTKQGLKSLQIFGEHNLQNLQAARLACEQIGVGENEFYEAIADFNGASNRLQKIVQTSTAVAYKDFAHSPSKLKATVQAVKAQYPNKKLVACMELHTFSSLTHAFLKEYKGSMLKADEAFVYFSPKVIEHKRLQPIDPQDVKEAFGGNNLEVYTDSAALQSKLRGLNYDNTALLLMTSGNFSGVNLIEFARELLGCN